MLKRMESTSTPLEEYVGGRVIRGVVTGLNSAFYIDDTARNQLMAKDQVSSEVIRPVLVGDDVRKWRSDLRGKWLLYMYHGVDPSRYPAIIEYLRPFQERLENRANKQKWYELQQPQEGYIASFGRGKIVFPDIAKEPRFAFDATGALIGDTVFAVCTSDLFLLGVLNSSCVWHYMKQTASVLGDAEKGGRLRLKRIYTSNIPIPRASGADKSDISVLVRRCLDAKGIGCPELEREIDSRILKLYRLAPEDLRTAEQNA
jgi:hypothetical protein